MHKKTKVTRSGYMKKSCPKNDKTKHYYYKGNQNSKTKKDFATNVGKGRVVSRKILSPGVSVKQGDIDFLNHTHTNYTRKKLVFVTTDKEDNPLFLETGDESDGLKHIRGRRKKKPDADKKHKTYSPKSASQNNSGEESHLKHFWQSFRLGYTRIPRVLKKTIVKGDTIPSDLTKYTGQTIRFRYKGGSIRVVFSKNGYIVTAYPKKKKKRRNKK